MGLLFRPVTAEKHSYFGIDLVRGLCAIGILIFHFNHFTMGGGALSRPTEMLADIEALRAVGWVYRNGSLAVMLFWAISGFVFMNVYAGTRVEAKTFWVNRLARLYPLHLLTLLVVAAVQAAAMGLFGHYLVYQANGVREFVLNLFLASAWPADAQHGESFNGPIWSVSIEVLIYLAFFLYARFARVNMASLIAMFGGFAVLMLLFRGNMIPVCGAYFFGGAIAYAVLLLCPERLRRPLVAAAAIGAIGVVAAVEMLPAGRAMPKTLWLLPVSACLLLLVAGMEKLGAGPLFRRMRAVGDVTYSTYLWHSPLQMLFLLGAGLGLWGVDIVATDVFFLGYLAFVIVFSWFSFRLFERPAKRLVRETLLGVRRKERLISAP